MLRDSTQTKEVNCEICFGNQGNLSSKPCGCNSNEHKVHEECMKERCNKIISKIDSSKRKKRISMECERCRQKIVFQLQTTLISWQQFKILLSESKQNILFFALIFCYMLYVLILNSSMLGQSVAKKQSDYWQLAPLILMIVLSSVILLTILIRSGMELLKQELVLKVAKEGEIF